MAQPVKNSLLLLTTTLALYLANKYYVSLQHSDDVARKLRSREAELGMREDALSKLRQQLRQAELREREHISQAEMNEEVIMKLTSDKQDLSIKKGDLETQLRTCSGRMEVVEKDLNQKRDQLKSFSDLAQRRSSEAQSSSQRLAHAQDNLAACNRMLDACGKETDTTKASVESVQRELDQEREARKQERRALQESSEESETCGKKVKELEERLGTYKEQVESLQANTQSLTSEILPVSADNTGSDDGSLASLMGSSKPAGGANGREWGGVRDIIRGIGNRVSIGGAEGDSILRTLKHSIYKDESGVVATATSRSIPLLEQTNAN